MKKKLSLIVLVMAIATTFAFAQGNPQGPGGNLFTVPGGPGSVNNPQPETICYGGQVSVGHSGQSFIETGWLWSTGEITPTINITTSGTYFVTVTGYLGNSSQSVTETRHRYYTVLPNPVINVQGNSRVCKNQTVYLTTNVPNCGGVTYEWFTGQGGFSTGPNFQHTFITNVGPPHPDTLSVYCKITHNGCITYTNTIIIRSYRLGQLADWFHNNNFLRLNLELSGFIPAGVVLNFPASDLLKHRAIFREVGNPSNAIIAETAVGSIQIPLNGLESGKQYDVEVLPVANGVAYCSGRITRIGIKPAPSTGGNLNRFNADYTIEETEKSFKAYPNPVVDQLNIETEVMGKIEIFDSAGRLMFSKEKTEALESYNISDFKPGLYIVVIEGARQKFLKK